MDDFLDVARNLLEKGELGEATEDFKRVIRGHAALQSVHSKSQLGIHNVEEVFSAFEMGRTLGRFPRHEPKEIESLCRSMKVVISRTIERTMRFRVLGDSVYAPDPYVHFAELIKHLREDLRPPLDVSIITFNYDVAADFALHSNRMMVDYGLSEEPNMSAVPLLKLHGSLNWGWCPECKQVFAWDLGSYFSRFKWQLDRRPEYVTLDIASHIGSFQHMDGHPAEPEPVIVPPTWNKRDLNRALFNVWRRAAAELADARDVFVIGYSLPPSDLFFRYLYSLGTVSETIIRRFWVFDPDRSGSVDGRFKALLGHATANRYKYWPQRFEQAMGPIQTPLV